MSGDDTNVTLDDPPPFNASVEAVEYFATQITNRFREGNKWRPQVLLTVNGTNTQSYYLGLAAVPIILLCVLIIWLVAICALGCWKYQTKIAGEPAPRMSLQTRQRVLSALLVLVVCAALSWMVASGFSLSSAAFQGSVSDDLSDMAELMNNITARLQSINASVNSCAQYTRGLSETCNISIPAVANAVSSLADLVSDVDGQALHLFNVMTPFASQAADGFTNAADVTDLVFEVRTGVIAALSLVELIFTVVALTFIAVAIRDRGQPRSTTTRVRKCCLEPSCACCARCCTPLLGFFVANIVITILFAAALHALALVIADACAPNVNVNINRVLGELQGFQPFAKYLGTDTNQMCDALNTTRDSYIVLSALCFYQTCDPTSPTMASVKSAVDNFLDRASNGKTSSQPLLLTIASNSTVGEACEANMIGVVRSLASTLSNGLWVFFYISCETVNELYAKAVYQSVCDAQTAYTVGLFYSWLIASVFTMVALLLWLAYAPDLVAGKEEDELTKPMIGPHEDHNSQNSQGAPIGLDANGLPLSSVQPMDSKPLNEGIVGEMDPSSSFLGGPVPSTNAGDKKDNALILV